MSDGIRSQADSQTLSVRPVRNRLLVTSVIGADQSTALISRSGERFDFNAADASGARFTPEASEGAKDESSPQMNNMDLYIPSFVSGPAQPGQIVARLLDTSGGVRAAFVYRGLTRFKDREAILMDLVRSYGGNEIGRTIGYSIIDRQRALPLLFEVGGSISIRTEQIDCQN